MHDNVDYGQETLDREHDAAEDAVLMEKNDDEMSDARDIAQEMEKRNTNNQDSCEYWCELDGEHGSVEYCNKHTCTTICCGSLLECPYLNGKQEGKKMEKEIMVRESIVMPAVTPEKAVEAFEAYQSLAKKIMTADDVQDIGGKQFKKKSFWRKCQRFFNLSINIVEEKREEVNGYFVYKFIVRATAPNGAFMDGTGTCSSNEKGLIKTEHNTRAIAETRAKNRAISDLVAFGEVSAEEIDGDDKVSTETETRAVPNSATSAGHLITEKQGKLLYARAKAKNIPDDVMKKHLKSKYGIDNSRQAEMDWMNDILAFIDGYK